MTINSQKISLVEYGEIMSFLLHIGRYVSFKTSGQEVNILTTGWRSIFIKYLGLALWKCWLNMTKNQFAFLPIQYDLIRKVTENKHLLQILLFLFAFCFQRNSYNMLTVLLEATIFSAKEEFLDAYYLYVYVFLFVVNEDLIHRRKIKSIQ